MPSQKLDVPSAHNLPCMEGVAAGRLGPKTTVAGIVLASLVPTSAFISGVSSNWIR